MTDRYVTLFSQIESFLAAGGDLAPVETEFISVDGVVMRSGIVCGRGCVVRYAIRKGQGGRYIRIGPLPSGERLDAYEEGWFTPGNEDAELDALIKRIKWV